MSQARATLVVAGVNTKEEIDRLERVLAALDGVNVLEVGIDRFELRYDQGAIDGAAIEDAARGAGAEVKELRSG